MSDLLSYEEAVALKELAGESHKEGLSMHKLTVSSHRLTVFWSTYYLIEQNANT
jgi:hypothetical protein